MNYMIIWSEEGAGFNGQWSNDETQGYVGELTVEPEGGFHGGWAWKVPGASGTSSSARLARKCAEAVFRALDGIPDDV